MNAPDEITLFQEDNIYVTNRRVMIGAKTYALSNITSVEMGRTEPSGCVPGILILAGVGAAGGGLIRMADDGFASAFVYFFVALAFIGMGVLAIRSAKPDFTVKIGSSSGESNVMQSKDEASIRRIVAAINDAIVKRT